MDKLNEILKLIEVLIYDYARNNPSVLDKNIIFRQEINLNSGQTGKITYNVPSGHRFYFYAYAGNYQPNSIWKEYVDGKIIAVRTAPPQSLQDHQRIYPCIEIADNKVEIEITNADAVAHNYIIEIRGWLRK